MFQRNFFLLVIFLISSGLAMQAQTPDSAINYYEHGTKKFGKGDLDGAIEDFTRAIEISSRLGSDRLARKLVSGATGFAASADEANEVTVIDPFTAKAFIGRGLARYKKGDIDEAIADWDRAIRINPGRAEAYLDRGAGHYVKGDTAGALADWNRALQINPRLAAAYCNRGGVRQKEGDLEGALADLNAAIALDPGEAISYSNRGFVWIEKRDFDRANSDFEKAIELNPRSLYGYFGRGIVRMSKDLDTAIADFNQVLQLNPNFVNAYMNRGLALLMQGRDTDAEKDFERCRALNPALKNELEQRIVLARELRALKP